MKRVILHSIVVATDDAATWDRLHSLLRKACQNPPLQASSLDELVDIAAQEKPDLALVDCAMVGAHVAAIAKLQEQGMQVVILADPARGCPVAREAMHSGARGLLSKDEPARRFVDSIRLVFRGAIVVSRQLGPTIWGQPQQVIDRSVIPQLSEREIQVAVLMARGESNRQIAQRLSLSDHTVKVHVANILAKLHVRNRQQVAVFIARQGLLDDQYRDNAPDE